jgi:hypothetical protein
MSLTLSVAILQILMHTPQHLQGMSADPSHLQEQATPNKDLSILKSVGGSIAAILRMTGLGK